jgi:hypothetical protein
MHTTMPSGLWCLELLPRRVNTLQSAERCRRGGVNMAVPDVLIALTPEERAADLAARINPRGRGQV